MARRTKKSKSYWDILQQVGRINQYLENTGRAKYYGNELGGSEIHYTGNTPQAQKVINLGRKYLNNVEKAVIKREGVPTGQKDYWGNDIINDKVNGQKIMRGGYWMPEQRVGNIKMSYSARAGSKG